MNGVTPILLVEIFNDWKVSMFGYINIHNKTNFYNLMTLNLQNFLNLETRTWVKL